MNKQNIAKESTKLVANWKALHRTFIRLEDGAARATLVKYMEQILFGLHDFLQEHVGITEEISLKALSERYKNTKISENPERKLADVITNLIRGIAPNAVNVASPYFVGHMTSAIPFFMVHLKTIVAALNQNVVKLETSKVVSIIEKQILAKVHRLIFDNSQSFYNKHVQNTETTLGCFVEGGTTANLTALWVARNSLLAPRDGFGGVEKEGISAAFREYGIERAVILVSRMGHYSLRKAAGILGIGSRNIIAIDVDEKHRTDMTMLEKTISEINKDSKTGIISVVGIAGSTETGSVDPLSNIAELCAENGIHFHVDAAWGGPILMSAAYRHLLNGIKYADSVTIDGHKQFYMPMSCGMVYFKNPEIMNTVSYHAKYVNRPGSVDLGIKSLAGSREANSLILDSALKIMGTKGYALLIDHGIETAKKFAAEIIKRPFFQLVTPPELNILTYRICPSRFRTELAANIDANRKNQINKTLNAINRTVQQIQRETGNSFVSRTTLNPRNIPEEETVVLRCVVMNPMTDIKILNEILDEQEKIYKSRFKPDA
ncbi:MAG: aminotransferase class V-fold PLP-dependent enzyme [Deltaproteobacteria bacterium]|nr:aminotransferase class V-fold PLP-dependent enzyme [Deltaproteobacteria bacterium]